MPGRVLLSSPPAQGLDTTAAFKEPDILDSSCPRLAAQQARKQLFQNAHAIFEKISRRSTSHGSDGSWEVSFAAKHANHPAIVRAASMLNDVTAHRSSLKINQEGRLVLRYWYVPEDDKTQLVFKECKDQKLAIQISFRERVEPQAESWLLPVAEGSFEQTKGKDAANRALLCLQNNDDFSQNFKVELLEQKDGKYFIKVSSLV